MKMNKKYLMIAGLVVIAGLAALISFLTNKSWTDRDLQAEARVLADYVTVMPDVTAEMLLPEFWLGKMKNPNGEIISAQQVAELNRQGYENSPYLNKLAEMNGSLSRDELNSHLDFGVPDGDYYIGNVKLTDEYWTKLKENINLAGVRDTNEARYGFVTQRADVRTYPTSDSVTDDEGDIAYDEFEETVSLTWEPVLIYHESLDKRFMYCATTTYFGWISKDNIAICRTRDEWLEAQNDTDFLLITGNMIKLDQNPFNPAISGIELYMGTKLPLVPIAEQPERIPNQVYGRRVFGNYVVKIPVRGGDGYAQYEYLPIPVSKDVHVGYLPYTYANVLNQVFKMQGDRYGWAGMMDARDCSSLSMELFRCFGIDLPRNGNQQEEYVGRSIDLSEMDSAQKDEVLTKQVKPGALLRIPGHIMVYLGKHNGKHYVISSSDGVGEDADGSGEYEYSRTRSVLVCTLDTKRASGKSWLEELVRVMCLDGI